MGETIGNEKGASVGASKVLIRVADYRCKADGYDWMPAIRRAMDAAKGCVAASIQFSPGVYTLRETLEID